jgi:hypothetical protein
LDLVTIVEGHRAVQPDEAAAGLSGSTDTTRHMATQSERPQGESWKDMKPEQIIPLEENDFQDF